VKRAIAIGIVVAGLAACDTTAGLDAGLVPVTDAGIACGPVDVTLSGFDGGSPETMRPPVGAHVGACSAAQVEDYAQCQGAKNTTLCPQFAPGGASAACGACIESPKQSPDGAPSTWGILVFNASTGTASFNIEGCVDEALGQVQNENVQGGTGSCGDLLHDSYGCQEAACSSCTGSPIDTCPPVPIEDAGDAGDADAADATLAADAADADDADDGDAAPCPRSDFAICVESALSTSDPAGCSSYGAKVADPNGPCAPLFDDAGPPADATACFPDPSIGDPTQQEVDWLRRIVTFMCGS